MNYVNINFAAFKITNGYYYQAQITNGSGLGIIFDEFYTSSAKMITFYSNNETILSSISFDLIAHESIMRTKISMEKSNNIISLSSIVTVFNTKQIQKFLLHDKSYHLPISYAKLIFTHL